MKWGLDVQEDALQAGAPTRREFGVEAAFGMGVVGAGEDVRESVETEPSRYVAFYEELERAIRLGSPPPVPLGPGVEVLRVIEAAIEGAAEMRVVVGGLQVCAVVTTPAHVTLAARRALALRPVFAMAREEGQSAIEWVGLVLLVSLSLGALTSFGPAIDEALVQLAFSRTGWCAR